MKPFLEILADELISKHGENLAGTGVVFPSRRACIFFKRVLAKKLDKPTWAPQILGIQDFVSMHSPYNVADNLELIFELYNCYKTEAAEESFDTFYPWGSMMLNDFDEIDRNLVEAPYLFRVMAEHKKIEEEFDFFITDLEEFMKFWKSFSNKDITDRQKDFIKTWKILGKVYKTFRERLIQKNICYEGMAYRRIFELVRENRLFHNYSKIIFAGFNQLNKAEELIIKELIKQDKAELYWDGDEYYVNNQLMEAGKFLRENFSRLGDNDKNWIGHNLKNIEKEINIAGAALNAGQVKALGYLLETLSGKRGGVINEMEKTAIILPDESILIPVLNSIPDSIDKLNITMGYPFRNSSLFSLLTMLSNLHKNRKRSVYYHKDCIEILSHPFIKQYAPEACNNAIEAINTKNIIYTTAERLLDLTGYSDIFKTIFSYADTPGQLIEYLFSLMDKLSAMLEEKDRLGQLSSPAASVPQRRGLLFEREFFFRLYEKINMLNNLISQYNFEGEIQTLWRLIIEIMLDVKIPFVGEPLKGLQVMGLLETRAIDFENVFILSMNEGTFPHAAAGGSFIPYNLRKAFKMSTYEDEDAVFAYYYYRLIQRAKKVFLIYNTEPVGIQPGEKSRFILQSEIELPLNNKNIKINNMIIQPGYDEVKDKEIIINKTEGTLIHLQQYKYSASALSQYINCSLKFYFNRVAGLRKDKTAEEAFSGASFGSLVHEIMRKLYAGHINKVISAEDIKAVKTELDGNFDEAWENACSRIDELREFAKEISGKNLLFKNVIKKLVGLILNNDIEQAPFKMLDVEGRFETFFQVNSHNITVTGRLDRVEEKNGVIRIIDYKTGKFKMRDQKEESTGEYYDKVFSDPAYKESFQQYYYAMIYNRQNPGTKINIGIYPIKSISGGVDFYENQWIEKEKLDEFSAKLEKLFAEILDPAVPFRKTPDINRCKFCDFTSICYRER